MDRQNLINRLVARKLQPAGNGQPRRGLCGPTTCWARTRCSAGTRRSGTAVEDGP